LSHETASRRVRQQNRHAAGRNMTECKAAIMKKA
jgi:hypothetical protein